ncbi:kinase [Sphingobium sp. CR2-8]|uniref:kinase n=1 Tax=Sphingobium sp. CR2-8 TaxID=1306534 RepID=UPI002DB9FE40|nr:kinase [Sphingobium sp. CR2-8]MEC3909339.1 kinase [Sphingobium sp. CR2-8]
MRTTIDALIAQERLPASYAATVDRWWRPLARRIAQWHASAGRAIIVGVNGAQGSGKSTVCRFLQAALLPEQGLSAIVVSLDDLYLPLAARDRLARDMHPLFRTRGVPGTHDVDTGIALLDALAAGRDASIPRFSKALDDQLPQADWTRHVGPVDVILFEGWCVGARPQDAASLTSPINRLEMQEDPDGIWRNHVNLALGTSYRRWFSVIDHLLMLKPPSFEHVLDNRLLQEQKLRRIAPDAPGIMDDQAVARFVSHYERVTRHMFADLPDRVDMLFQLDAKQAVISAKGLHHHDWKLG